MIRVEDDLPLRRLVIDRPEKANALSMAMLRDLAEGIASAPGAGAAVILLSGAGTKSFCTGAEVADLGPATRGAQAERLRCLVAAFSASQVPIVTLVHGRTLGAGCALVALSDIVIASADARLGFPEIRFGLYPAVVHATLVEKLPAHLAHQICIAGRDLDASTARDLGLVTECLAPEDFVQRAQERVAFYVERLHAVSVGRALWRQTKGDDLVRRVAAMEPIIDRNLEDPDTRRLFDGWLASLSRKVGERG